MPGKNNQRAGKSKAERSTRARKAGGTAARDKSQPATVPGTERDGRPGVLRFDFPNFGGGRLRAVDWDEWFETFDERRLVFLFQEQMTRGTPSNFFRLDSPDREEG